MNIFQSHSNIISKIIHLSFIYIHQNSHLLNLLYFYPYYIIPFIIYLISHLFYYLLFPNLTPFFYSNQILNSSFYYHISYIYHITYYIHITIYIIYMIIHLLLIFDSILYLIIIHTLYLFYHQIIISFYLQDH